MDLNKYDMPKEQKQKLNDWKESVPVVVLSDALKIVGRKHGIYLFLADDGRPTLSFRPGLGAKDTIERWDVKEQIEKLFLNACDDMRELITSNKITLPEYRRTP